MRRKSGPRRKFWSKISSIQEMQKSDNKPKSNVHERKHKCRLRAGGQTELGPHGDSAPSSSQVHYPKVLKEIVKYKNSTELLLPKQTFAMVIRDIAKRQNINYKWEQLALLALQEISEAVLVHLFEDAYLISVHSKRVTLQVKDYQLARRIKGISNDGM